MNILDVRTVLTSYTFSSLICMLVMASLWTQNRKKSPELIFWLACFTMQFLAVLFLSLRNVVPDLISVVLANTLLLAAALALLVGLQIYFDQPRSNILNYGLLAGFVLLHTYFTFGQPSLLARNLNISVGLVVFHSQMAWLILRPALPQKKQLAKPVGYIFILFVWVSAARTIAIFWIPSTEDFLESGLFDTLVILSYQMLEILLTFALFLMVNRGLAVDQEEDIRERHEAEKALLNSEEKRSIAFHHIPEAIAITTIPEGRFIEVNESFYRMSDFTPEDIAGKTTLELNLWGNPAERVRFLELVRQRKVVSNFETTFRKKSGQCFTGLISGEIFQLHDQTCLLTVIRDISERKCAELEIERLASYPRLNPNPVLEVNAQGKVIFHNAAAQAALSAANLASPQAFLPGDTGEMLSKLAAGEAAIFHRELSLGERLFEETIQATPDFQCLHLYAVDITESRHSEATIQSTQNELKRLLAESEQSRRALLSLAEDQKMMEAEKSVLNQRMEILVGAIQKLAAARDLDSVMVAVKGYARQLIGSDGTTFVLRENDQCYYAEEDAIYPLWKGQRFPLSQCISGWVMLNKAPAIIPDIFTDERIPIESYRQTFVKSLIMVPIRSQDPLGAIGNYWAKPHLGSEIELQLLQTLADAAARAVENVRLLEELESRVRQRTLELEASNKELEAFAYSVSHDLRAPLRSIDGFTSILQKDHAHGLNPEGQRLLSIIRRSAVKMDRLIQDLLALSRVSRSQVNFSEIDMAYLARSAYQELATPEVLEKFSFTVLELPKAFGDVTLMRQVWINLISNAIKYTFPQETCCIQIDGEEKDGCCIYSIRDNGVGFDPAFSDRLFQLFQRLHKESEFPGTGIGLAIIQRIIHRHGGTVWAESQLDQGATFHFSIPRPQSHLE